MRKTTSPTKATPTARTRREPPAPEAPSPETGEHDAPRPGAPPWLAELSQGLGWNPLACADIRPIVRSCSRTLDTWALANRIALGAALAVAECQWRVVRQAAEDGLEAHSVWLRAPDPGRALPEHAWHALQGIEHLIENLRQLSETVARSQSDMADALEQRLTDLTEEVEDYARRLRQ